MVERIFPVYWEPIWRFVDVATVISDAPLHGHGRIHTIWAGGELQVVKRRDYHAVWQRGPPTIPKVCLLARGREGQVR